LQGKHRDAGTVYRRVLARLPVDSPQAQAVREQLEALDDSALR
jgi:hypothetical protein